MAALTLHDQFQASLDWPAFPWVRLIEDIEGREE